MFYPKVAWKKMLVYSNTVGITVTLLFYDDIELFVMQ